MPEEKLEPSFFEVSTNKHKGILLWLLTVDHKRIGLMYLYTMMFFFTIAVFFGFLIRLELLTPGRTIVGPQTYNQLFTLHGIIMIFLFIIPGLPAVFGNFFLPIMIGAKDVIFPRLNLLSWYLFIAGGLTAGISIFLPGGPADTGWMFYVPYSV
ncbi:MAG: cbb3-type cytochrome c oxidase subunit I, partial [Bacteroidota bacterium]